MTDDAPLVLASASPRRRELLSLMGIAHEVLASGIDESLIPADHPRTFALRAAYAKACDVAARVEPGRIVLGADTVVTRDGVLYGKPESDRHAREMLRELAGREHEVITGIAVMRASRSETHLNSETTLVRFRALTDDEVDRYLATGEHRDKAGAYGIQGAAGGFVEALTGDYYNVMGLPCGLVSRYLLEMEWTSPITLPSAPSFPRKIGPL